MARRKFTREFKLSAVQLVNQKGHSVAETARSLGIDPGNVCNWIEQLGSKAGAPSSEDGAMALESAGCAR